MIVLIVAMSMLTAIITERYKTMRKTGAREAEDERRMLRDDRDAARAELDELRDRVKVLERIATDPSRRTADEIEKLRDDR
ncbi:hypothetical protein MKP08_05845 [Erythrobacter sp. LQ02-29]|uniref:hypothetical protein n=1 Tax=Erythrobacter sp. LQ02-29 TaxID=2920384 RepID=UPI001F4F0069|nr:hypothetical protein [Erythrobacter sp. LQ02-29]MCP9222267.1 hypothetical protein [Erythrobacter sp. LQ02-29]